MKTESIHLALIGSSNNRRLGPCKPLSCMHIYDAIPVDAQVCLRKDGALVFEIRLRGSSLR